MTDRRPVGARPTLEDRLDEVVRECVAEVVQSAKQIIEEGKLQDAGTQCKRCRFRHL